MGDNGDPRWRLSSAGGRGRRVCSRREGTRRPSSWIGQSIAAYRQACTEQIAYAPAGAGVCPPLIPAGRLKVIHADPFSERKAYRGGYLADVSSASLSELDGEHVETNGGHWHYDVSWRPAVRRLLVHRGVERPVNANKASACRELMLGSERVEACRVVPYEQGGGLNGGHIAYVDP